MLQKLSRKPFSQAGYLSPTTAGTRRIGSPARRRGCPAPATGTAGSAERECRSRGPRAGRPTDFRQRPAGCRSPARSASCRSRPRWSPGLDAQLLPGRAVTAPRPERRRAFTLADGPDGGLTFSRGNGWERWTNFSGQDIRPRPVDVLASSGPSRDGVLPPQRPPGSDSGRNDPDWRWHQSGQSRHIRYSKCIVALLIRLPGIGIAATAVLAA